MSAAYASLQRHLETLVDQLSEGSLDNNKNLGTQLVQFWQQELAPLQGEWLSTEVYHQWRSLHTELHRELRLLKLDLMFLGNSRSAATRSAKEKTVGDRLEKLLQYCGKIQQIIAVDDPHTPAE